MLLGHMNRLSALGTGLLVIVIFVMGSACATPVDETIPPYRRTVEPRSKLVLYTPSLYAVSPTFSSVSGAGFRLEDPKRETLAAVLEVPASQLSLIRSSSDVTSANYAAATVHALMALFRTHIPELLPFASPDETVGDWSLTTVNSGTTLDLRGNHVAYAHYSLQVAPIYQLRTPEVIQYLARTFLGANWQGFPRNDSVYFPAGQNIIEIVLAVSVHNDVGYANDSDRIGVSFAALPNNNSTVNSVSDIDDILAFKTLGNVRDTLVTRTKSFAVGKRGEPIDMVFAIDGNQTMVEEATALKTSIPELIAQLAADTSYDFRVAFITNSSEEFVRFADGSRFLSADSKKPEELAALALETIFAKVNEIYTPRNDLLRRAVLAITEPSISSTNADFNRPNAPLLLVYISDRDDASPAPDNSSLTAFASQYAVWLRGYDQWIAFVPSDQGCKSTNLDTAAAATNVYATGSLAGATMIDMCRTTPPGLNNAVLAWSEEHGSSFRFAPPQPMNFSLKVSANGNRLPQSQSTGYVYDFLGDRLRFSNTTTPRVGDEIGVSYLTLEAPVVFEKR